ncbi:MAG: helix-turn-helix transcriptional regulator [Austwickia sp.]|jgi:DNA-binding XRE family transcriptional regulator|nr:MAG: helix-turn-helix transcriptional regulator [Austwickia sp.]
MDNVRELRRREDRPTPAPAAPAAPAGPAEPRKRGPLASGPEPLWREAIGEQLRAVRQARGERIADVAGRAGIAPQYLSEIERGRKDASSEMLAAVAGSLGLRLIDLTGGATRRLADPRGRGQVRLAA